MITITTKQNRGSASSAYENLSAFMKDFFPLLAAPFPVVDDP